LSEFVPGQRWISDAELELCLGTILSVDERTVQVAFPATEEVRTYAWRNAPLTRIQFLPGDTIYSEEGWRLKVEDVQEEEGLLFYQGRNDGGEEVVLSEMQLQHATQLNRPVDRLLTGQLDKSHEFNLRYATRKKIDEMVGSPLRGLTGVRTDLIAHQLYIAHEVSKRYSPRVLLADEVGLGKTIEAGLILHHQLLTEQVNKVLIVVPQNLIHQWLVEMLRRFNLRLSIFDEERYAAMQESDPDINPFALDQIVLLPLEFVVSSPERFNQIQQAGWEMLVVDEAHHLQWSEQEPSVEYLAIAKLAEIIPAVLLLTATPEQLGRSSHFARLRLLDPNRFHSLEAFNEEEESFTPVAAAVEALLDLDEVPASETVANLKALLSDDASQKWLDDLNDEDQQVRSAAAHQLADTLMDRHGTGRLLFRNTRAAIEGFPERMLHAYPLEQPLQYQQIFSQLAGGEFTEQQLLLSPELIYQALEQPDSPPWASIDPRVVWLDEHLKTLKPEKVLVICASAGTALDLAESLRVKSGLHAAVFHEEMSIIERDRSAAYFADPEFGTQVLIASEIGSEGRNFQFAHHLVLFDLPYNPDLLEQRIGRLDRIGQKNTIDIHVPYLENTAQHIIFDWYHQGLNAFENTCPEGHGIYAKLEDRVLDLLYGLADSDAETAKQKLLEDTKALHNEMTADHERGRNRLLEYNSCRPQLAAQLQQQGLAQDQPQELKAYLDVVFDAYGVEHEESGDHKIILHPSEHLQTNFPHLLEDGMTVTVQREVALSNDDIHFLTWEHPMLTGVIDMVVTSEIGNTALTALAVKGLDAGTVMVETLYIIDPLAAKSLQCERYLEQTMIRLLIANGKGDISKNLSHEMIIAHNEIVNKKTSRQIIKKTRDILVELINQAEELARTQMQSIIAQATQAAQQQLTAEVERLQALQQVNPNVRDTEIEHWQNVNQEVQQALSNATLRLDAVRVIIIK